MSLLEDALQYLHGFRIERKAGTTTLFHGDNTIAKLSGRMLTITLPALPTAKEKQSINLMVDTLSPNGYRRNRYGMIVTAKHGYGLMAQYGNLVIDSMGQP